MMFDGAAVTTAAASMPLADPALRDAAFASPFVLDQFISGGLSAAPAGEGGYAGLAFVGPAPVEGPGAQSGFANSAARDGGENSLWREGRTGAPEGAALVQPEALEGDSRSSYGLAQPTPFAGADETGVDRFQRNAVEQMVLLDEGAGQASAIAIVPNAFVFIDTSVTGHEQLAAEWAGRGTIVLIDGSRDGIDQIRTALVGVTDIDAIHIVSHGDDGVFWIGSTRVDQASVLGELGGSLAAIGAKLRANGDILIYGCDVGAGPAGQGLLDSLALKTGADIAASVDDTGHILRGGDWTLENRLGVIDGPTLRALDWQGLLAPAQLRGIAANLTVRDANGNLVTISGGGQSAAVGAGATARWTNAATINGQQVDLVATVVSTGGVNDLVRFNRSGTNGTLNDDFGVLLQTSGTSGTANAIITWSIVRTGTNTPVVTDVTFTVADIDGVAGVPLSRESVVVSTDTLSSYQNAAGSRVNFINSPGAITAAGTQDESGAAESGARFNWLNTGSFTITYQLNRANGLTTQALFNHDGDLDFDLGTGGVTVSIPRLDLDANDSNGTGSGYRGTYVENRAAIPIVDSDVRVTNPQGNVVSATVTLTNAQIGDTLTFGTLPAGLTATTTTSGGQIVITITGSGSAAQYEQALRTLSFSNTSERPATVERVITSTFTNGTLNSNVATSRIQVVEINDPPEALQDGPFNAPEDGTLGGINVLANDRDGDGDPLTVISATAPEGRVTINPDGTLTYRPNAGFSGRDTITYTISDGRGRTSTATVLIDVVEVNDPPNLIRNPPDLRNNDGANVNVNYSNFFTDPDGDPLTFSATGLPPGLSINPATGEISGRIDRSASQGAPGGIYTVTLTADDRRGGVTSGTFTWTIANPAPVALSDNASTLEDTPIAAINVLGNDGDPDGDPLTVISATAQNGTATINPDGTLRYVPNANFNGTDTIVYSISDGQGGRSTATVFVNVQAQNDPPVPVGFIQDRSYVDGQAGIAIPTAQAFRDVDGDTLTYIASGLPPGLTLNPVTGVISGTVDRSASQGGQGGSYQVLVLAGDGRGGGATQYFNIDVSNPAPVAVNDVATTDEDVPVAITLLANDSDPDGDPLRVTSASAANGSVTINPDGTVTYTPNLHFNGSDTITYSISDGQGGTATATVAVTVVNTNDPPVLAGQIPNEADFDSLVVTADYANNFSDPDGDPLTFSATGLPPGLTIDAATGRVSGRIAADASQGGPNGDGVYQVTITADDGRGGATSGSFAWSVSNPPPTALNDNTRTVEDLPVDVFPLTNDSDPDGDPLSIVSANAANGTVVISAPGVLRYTPNANFNGTDTITYRISDGNGGFATATVRVTVMPANDPPVLLGRIFDDASRDSDRISADFTRFFRDPDGDTLKYSATGLPPGLSIDPATGQITGRIISDASQGGPNGDGIYPVTITATDSSGAAASGSFNWAISNPPPVAVNDFASTNEDTPIAAINVRANDYDPDGDLLTVTAVSALNGTVTINADNTLRYVPNANFNGTDTITYEISDGQGGTATATVAVTVDDVNDPPVRVGTIGNLVNQDGQLVVTNVASAFADPDGDPLTFVAAGLPAGMAIDPVTGVISGTIDRNASQVNGGVYTVTIAASDGRGGTVSQTFTWTITNPGPSATNDAAATNEDTAVQIPVLINDVDPDGDPLTVTQASAGNGTVVINPNGTLTYTPDRNFNGTDTILYTISDGNGGTATASVTVTVRPVNDRPETVGLPNQNGDDGASVSIPTASAFSDPDGDVLTFSATGLPPSLAIDPATGLITGTLAPDTSENGPYVVTVTATDPSGASVTTSFVFAVQNIPPVARNDVASTPEDMPVRVAVLTNDSDPDGDPLTIISATANNGTVQINPDGTLTFTPAPNFNGVTTVSYTVSDGEGGLATATLTITVGAVNDAPTSLPIPDQASTDGSFYSAGVAPFFDDVDGDRLSFSATGLPAGLSIDAATGVVSGTIDRNASQVNGGVYRVTITATDPSGASTSRTLFATVNNPRPVAANDVASTNEDTATTINVLANDNDPDGDPLSVVSAGAINGTVQINPDGTLAYLPNANFNGIDTITYRISDGNGGFATASVQVTVIPVNDVPVANPDQISTNEDTPVVINPLGNDTDVDRDPLQVTAATSPNGTVVVNPDGTIVFTPAPNFNGPATISYTISDGRRGTATGTITVTVDPVNDAPVANPSTATTNEDTPVVVPVLANDSDPDGDPLTVSAASAANGIVTINADGTVTYTPNANFNGTDTITYTISDGNGGFSTSTVTVTVNAVNDAPVLLGRLPDTPFQDGDIISGEVTRFFSDPDGDVLTYSMTGLPAGISLDPVTGRYSGRLAADASQGGPNGDGVYTITVTASDGNGGAVSSTFNWVVTNPGPTANNDLATTSEDMPIAAIDVLGNDFDPDGDPLRVTSATANHGTVTINPDGTLRYVPDANFNGTDTIVYSISDGQGGTSLATVTVTVTPVNDAPTVTPLPARANLDNAAVSVPVAGNFADLDGDPLTFSASGLPAGLSINPTTGIISGTIDRSASQVNGGVYAVTVTASDGKGGTVSSTFSWTVTNPPPSAANDVATTAEDTPVTIPVLTNDSDPDGDTLLVLGAAAANGQVVINADGTITYTPNLNFSGTDVINYRIGDGDGGFATAAVSVTVTAVNDAPVSSAAPLPNVTQVDGGSVNLPNLGATAFVDPDGDPLTFSATGLPPGLSIDPATGSITGTIANNASQTNGGIYTVTLTGTDSGGLSFSRSFAFTVTNPGPVANDDVATTSEDAPIAAINVLGNDSDPDGDTLTVTSATATNGTVTINPDGTLRYVPNANFNGTDTITYAISDGQGGVALASVTVTVTPVNDVPTAGALPARNNLDGAVISVPVAGNFADLDGDTLSFAATGLPAGLSINPTAGVISGTIDRAASQVNGGLYSVTVTASDGNGGTASATFAWTVTNPPPTAADDAVTTAEDTPLSFSVLANDSDPDGDPLTVVSASARRGTVVINGDGTLTYTPNADFAGIDRITYRISDGNGGFDTATVTVTVTAVNDAPRTNGLPDLFDIDNNVVSVPVGPAFSDPEGDTLTFSAAGLPAGLSINPATGQIFGQIASNASTIGGGIYTVTITADDGNGGVTSTTFTWTITNTAPLASDDVATTNEDTPVTIDVLGNDTDPDLDPLTVVSATATNGSVVVNADGTVTFTPDPDFNGTATVSYLITDNNGGFSTATAVITVNPVNDAPTVTPLPDQNDIDGTVVSILAGTQFADVEGDTLAFSATGLPAGISINPATGEISGTIDPGASQVNGGIYLVTVTADDGNGGTVSSTFVWTITNLAPRATDDVATTNEDSPVTVAVLTNDVDPDGDPLTVTGASALNGTVVINPDGIIGYTPNANFNGTDTITYTIGDGNGGTSTAIVTVTVNPGNDAPTVQPLPARSNVDGATVSVPIAGNFADLDGDPLSYSATGLPTGLTIDPVSGIISGTIDRAASQGGAGGVYSVTVTANDGNGGTVSTTFSWTVTNPPPVAANDTATTPEDTPVDILVLANDNDPDGDPLAVTTASAGNGTVTIGAGGVLTYTPNADFNGTDTITYTISDGNGGTSTATVTVTVNPVNDAPTSTPIAARSNPDGATIALPVGPNFSDVDNVTLAFSATGLPAGLTIDPATGLISGTIDRNASQPNGGIYSVTVTASDAGGLTTSQTFTWTVTNPPPIAVNDLASTPEDFPVNINVLANDSDPDGDPLTVTTASAANGTVVILPNGTIDYTPGPNFNGTDTITYTISDGNGGTATATATVTVGPVNDPPVAVNDATSTNEDTPVTIPVLANDSDIDGNPLTVTAATSPDGTVLINPDGTITFTPAPNFNGVATIVYTISDGQGGTATATATVVVNPVNDQPVAVNDTASTPEDTPVTLAPLVNDSDVDGDRLVITAATSPNGAVTINPDGTITFTPTPNFNGPTTISYTISDGRGGASTATITLTVAAVNDLPVANLSTATTNEDTPITLTPLANDTDADGNPLTVTAANAANGTVTINPDGTVRYVPNPNFNGTDVVTYTISDGQGGTATSTVTVTVNSVNDVPVAGNDMATTPEDSPVTIPVLANDRDADGNPLTVTAASSPNGTVVINPDGTITFRPAPNFNGPATINYTISDGQGGTATATVAVNVTPVNDRPVAVNDNATTPEDTPVTIAPLVNDSDVDGNSLTITSATSPNGRVTINANGTIIFTPDPNFNGPTTISYTVSDGQGGTATASIAVTVTAVNDPPVARNDAFTMDENTSARIPVLANDTDADNDPLTVTAASSPNGTVTINPDGTISFTPARDFFGAATITYTVSDGRGGLTTATVAVNVVNTNNPPVDGDESISTIGGVLTPINVLANAADADRDRLSVFFAEVERGQGTVTINADGTLSFIAPEDFQGVAVIRYIVSDGRGGFDVSFVTITVTEATADINALLGIKNEPGTPDGWLIDGIRDQSEEFIDVPLIVDQTANDFRSLRPTPMLFGERPLLTAVNAIGWLRGLGDLGAHPVDHVVRYVDDIRDLRFGADRLFDPRFGDFVAKGLTGFSVRAVETENGQIMIEAVVRDRVIYVEIRDVGADGDPAVVEYQLRMGDGGALPEWIHMDSRGLAIIERPADAEEISVIVRAIRADGKVVEVPVVIQGATGEIQLDGKVRELGKISAVPLGEAMALAGSAAADEAARLLAAFKG